MSERPTKLAPEMALKIANEIVAAMVKCGHIESGEDPNLYAADIAKHGNAYSDGYELARDLDRYCGWDLNFDMVEELNGFSYAASRAIEDAQKEWAERENIQPPHPVGTRVKLRRGETGEITEVYKHGAAKFLVKIDGDAAADGPSASRRIVNFEDVEKHP